MKFYAIRIFVVLLVASSVSCQNSNCENRGKDIYQSKVWNMDDVAAEDFGTTVAKELHRWGNMDDLSLQQEFENSGFRTVRGSNLLVDFYGDGESLSYVYTIASAGRSITYRSYSKKTYEVLLEYLKANDFTLASKKTTDLIVSEEYTSGDDSYSVQFSKNNCFVFVSYSAVVPSKSLCACWEQVDEKGDVMTFRRCSATLSESVQKSFKLQMGGSSNAQYSFSEFRDVGSEALSINTVENEIVLTDTSGRAILTLRVIELSDQELKLVKVER